MMDLRDAKELFYGNTEVKEFYLGGVLIWEKPKATSGFKEYTGSFLIRPIKENSQFEHIIFNKNALEGAGVDVESIVSVEVTQTNDFSGEKYRYSIPVSYGETNYSWVYGEWVVLYNVVDGPVAIDRDVTLNEEITIIVKGG